VTGQCPADGCEIEAVADVAYVDGDTPRSSRFKPLMDVYAPVVEGPWPSVVVAPGWGMGKNSTRNWAEALASQGAVVFAVDYEIGPPANPTPLPYLNCAARYVREVAGEYGGDPSRVTLLGYSLGATYGAPVSLGVDDLTPGCLASLDAAIPDAFVGYEGYVGVGDEEMAQWLATQGLGWPDATPLVGGNPDLVVRLIHGASSEAPVAITEEFAQILVEAGYDVDFTVVEGATHSGAEFPTSPAFDVIVDTTMNVARG
jgi:acetyl esterase/lipase